MAFNIPYNFIAVDKFTGPMRRINKSVNSVNENIRRTQKSFSNFGAKFTTRVTLPLAAFAGIALKSAAQVETFEVKLGVLLRSTEKAKDLLKELTDFTARTPFQLPGVVNTASQLLSFGFEAKNITETLRILGDVSAGSGSKLGEIGLIFGQISAAGKLTGERFLQLAERGVPIARSLARITGLAETQIPDAISKGLIKFNLVNEAFKDMTKEGGIFFKATEKQSRTLGGLFSTLKDNIFLSFASIGQTLVDTFDLKDKVSGLIEGIANLTQSFNNFVKNNPRLAKFLLIMTGILALLGPLAIGLASVLGIMATFGAAIGIAFLPITAAVIGISALIALIVINFDKIKAAISFVRGFVPTDLSGFSGGAFGSNIAGSQGQVPLTQQESKSTVDVNINAPEGTVRSVASKSDNGTNLNLGMNRRLATSGAI